VGGRGRFGRVGVLGILMSLEVTHVRLDLDRLERTLGTSEDAALGEIILVRVLELDVVLERLALDGRVIAQLALVRLHALVSHFVTSQGVVVASFVRTNVTLVWFFARVLSHVKLKHGFPRRLVVADLTNVGLEFAMNRLDVLLQTL